MPKANAQPARVEPDGVPSDPEPSGPASGTRRRLLDAAARAIASHGWGSVTTRQVAAIAGVNPALVHYHFASMAALRREAALAVLLAQTEPPTAVLLGADDPADGVRRCLDALAALDPDADHVVVLYETMLAATRDHELRADLDAALAGFRAAIAERLTEAGAADPAGSAATLAAALDGAFLHRLITPDFDVTALAPTLIAGLALPGRDRAASPGRARPSGRGGRSR